MEQTNKNVFGVSEMTDWLELCIPGSYQQVGWSEDGPYIKTVDITAERLQRIVTNFKPELREPVVMVGHYPYDQKALAWVGELKFESVLLGRLKDISPTFRTIIANKEYKYFSIGTEFADLEDSLTEYLEHLACTNFPLVPGMKSFPDTITGIKASRNVSSVFTSKINFESFSKGLHPENLKSKKSMLEKIRIIASKLGVTLTEGLGDEAALELCSVKCDQVVTENGTLKTDLEAAKLEASTATAKLHTSIIASAKESGKILEAEVPTYEQLLKDSPETTIALLASKQPSGIYAANQVKNSTKNESSFSASTEDKSKWGYKEYSKKDPEGLKAMRVSRPEEFKKIWKDEFKTDFVEA